MRPLHIELARPRRWPLALAALAILLLALASACAAWWGWSWQQEARRVRATPAAVAQPAPAAAVGPTELHLDDARALVRIAEAPVGELLAAVEGSVRPGLRVVRLEIDNGARQATLELEAPGHAEAMVFLERLQAASTGPAWTLTRSQLGAGTPSSAQATFDARW